MPTHAARYARSAAAMAAASHSSHATAAGAIAMRAELVVYTALAAAGAAAGEALDAPDFATRLMMILFGTLLGSVAAAFAFDNASVKERASRGLLSLSAGPVISYIALSQWPTHGSFHDAREWVVVVAAVSAFAAWSLVRWAQKRGVVDATLDAAAEKFGVRTNKRKRKPAPDEHEQGDQ